MTTELVTSTDETRIVHDVTGHGPALKETCAIYSERISSARTEALFLALTILFGLLFVWRMHAGSPGILGIIFLCFCAFFLFCSINYRTLTIRLTPESLKLRFGIFARVVPVANIEECRLDGLPALMRYGHSS